jgi:release factor glutamine methyltransferase
VTIREALTYSIKQLGTLYETREAEAISEWLLENISGTKKADRKNGRDEELNATQEEQLNSYLQSLLTNEPLQYVLHEAWFCGFKFYVDKNVLIPRPETEELVEWIISNCKFPITNLNVLDIGTGSGCIAISIKRRIRKADVYACDISNGALDVAKRNAMTLGAEVNFHLMDFLDDTERTLLPCFDIIVSNPPYVPEKDKETMAPNVVQYEPHTALFVPDHDALVFYESITRFGKEKLNPGGTIYVEIHERLGESTEKLFQAAGYNTELKKDMQGKDRLLKAWLG